jgi:hypothetical protein
MLVRILDDFGPDNWTSKVRNCTAGLPPFYGSANAVFTYNDTRGQLTRAWFGPEGNSAWLGRWPRYHIEVKTTCGEANEPFHMSKDQMITVRSVRSVINADGGVYLIICVCQASKFSERAKVSTDMYVIMRVSRINMPEPEYKVYADPHRALFYGQLQYVHDIYLQRNTEPQVGV